MARKKLSKNVRVKDLVRSTPKVTHTHSMSGVAKSVPTGTHRNRIKNLGKYAYPRTRLPAGVGDAPVKTRKRKSSMKGY